MASASSLRRSSKLPRKRAEMLVASCSSLVRIHKLDTNSSDGLGSLHNDPAFLCNQQEGNVSMDIKECIPKVTSLSFNHNGQALFCAAGNCIKLYVKEKDQVFTLPLPADESGKVTCLTISRDSRYLVTGGDDGVLRLWDIKKEKVIKNLYSHPNGGKVTCVTFNSDNNLISSGSTTGHITVYSLRSNKKIAVFRDVAATAAKENSGIQAPISDTKPYPVRAIKFNRFRKNIVAACTDGGSIYVYDVTTLNMKHSFPQVHQAPATDLCFSPYNKGLLISVGLDKAIVFVDTEKCTMVTKIRTDYPLTSVAFSPSGDMVVAGTIDGKVLLFNLSKIVKDRSRHPIQVLNCHNSEPVNCVQFHLPSSSKSSRVSPATISSTSNIAVKPAGNTSVPAKEVNKREKSVTTSVAANLHSPVASLPSTSAQSVLFSPPMSVKKALEERAKNEAKLNTKNLPPVPTFNSTSSEKLPNEKTELSSFTDKSLAIPESISEIPPELPSTTTSQSILPQESTSEKSAHHVPDQSQATEDNKETSPQIYNSLSKSDLASCLDGFQEEMLKGIDSKLENFSKSILDELREERRIENNKFQIEMLRQFRLQMSDISSLVENITNKFANLEEENRKLKIENERLSKLF